MTVTSGWFDTEEMNGSQLARGLRALQRSGVDDLGYYGTLPGRAGSSPDALDVVTSASPMQWVVKAGLAWVGGSWVYNDDDYTLTVPENGTAVPRLDLVVVRRTGGSPGTGEIDILTGTPGSNPVAPAYTQDEDPAGVFELPLFEVACPASAGPSTMLTGGRTDRRRFLRYRAAQAKDTSTIHDGGSPNVWNNQDGLKTQFYVPESGRWTWTIGSLAYTTAENGRADLGFRVYRGNSTSSSDLVLDTNAVHRVATAQTLHSGGETVHRSEYVDGYTPGLYTIVGATRNSSNGDAYYKSTYVAATPCPDA